MLLYKHSVAVSAMWEMYLSKGTAISHTYTQFSDNHQHYEIIFSLDRIMFDQEN